MNFKDRNSLLIQKQMKKKAAHRVGPRKKKSGQKVIHPKAISFPLPVYATSHSVSHMAASPSERKGAEGIFNVVDAVSGATQH